MARFLFTVWPYPGHVHPNVAIGHALVRRGHEVAFYTGASRDSFLQKEGFRVFPFEHVDEAQIERLVLALDGMSLKWWTGLKQKALLRQWLLGSIDGQLADLDAIFSIWHPDVVVCDPAMWGPLLVLRETRRVPVAVMSYVAACMLPGPEGPIIGLSLRKARGPVSRLARRLLRSISDVLASDVRRDADEVRTRRGLAAIGVSVTEFAGRMPLYLLPSTPSFDRSRRDLPSSVHYVGPCEWDKSAAAPQLSWLAELSRDRPVVYVTEGTMHSKPPVVLRAALEGLAASPVQVIATTGQHRDPASLGFDPMPSNARVERFVAHSELLPHVDVVVTTGGTGTVMAALSAGLPLVIVPTAWDQPENAWRVLEAGAGIRVPARRCSPAAIRRAVGRVLRDPSYRENARRIQRELKTCGGAAQAADLLVDLVASPRLTLLKNARSETGVPGAAARTSA